MLLPTYIRHPNNVKLRRQYDGVDRRCIDVVLLSDVATLFQPIFDVETKLVCLLGRYYILSDDRNASKNVESTFMEWFSMCARLPTVVKNL